MTDELFEELVSEFERAYLVTGMTPRRNTVDDGQGGGCAIGALRRMIGGKGCYKEGYFRSLYGFSRGFWDVFTTGVEDGFDGVANVARRQHKWEGYSLGEKVGREVARRVFSPAPVEKVPGKEAVTA